MSRPIAVPDVMTILSTVASDRAVPEDAVRVFEFGDGVAFVVADGAGGMGGGALAARIVVEAFEAEVTSIDAEPTTSQRWCKFLRRLDARLADDAEAGESTAVVAVITHARIVGASVGDSEAWIVGRDRSGVVLTEGQHKSRLGSGQVAPVGFEAAVGDSVVLAATDGLFHAASADDVDAVLRADPTPDKLVALARSPSGKLYDDVGLVVVAHR